MDCSRISSLFSAGLDGDLDDLEQAAFKRHLAECGECQRQWHLFQATVEQLHGLEPLEPPLGIISGVQARLQEEEKSSPFYRLLAFWRRFDFSVTPATAAATLALALLLAVLAQNETFFADGTPGAGEKLAASPAVDHGSVRSPVAMSEMTMAVGGGSAMTMAAGGGSAPSSRDGFAAMATHPPAIRVPVLEHPDVLMVLPSAPPEVLPDLWRANADRASWRLEYLEQGLLLVDLPAAEFAELRRMLQPYPVAVAPVAALSPNFGRGKGKLRVAIRSR
ncbi:MAG: zf-HC2 domain-containing protein [Desulfurivibrio sp.]|nr:zf-HC2 domain-containing protein [Desulfurivibrio sp.]